MVSGLSFGSSAVSLACISSMCSVQCFPGSHSLRLAFGSFFYPHPSPPFILSLLNQCDRCLVPLAWGLMAGGHGFASHGGVTLSRGWLCQRWKTLDIPGTHLHSVTQLLIILQTPMKYQFFCCMWNLTWYFIVGDSKVIHVYYHQNQDVSYESLPSVCW